MPPKPRQIKVEHRSAIAAMSKLEEKSDEELEAETKFRSAAQAILGSRAAQRYDAKAAREHFRLAIASARPQERMQLRRMAEASLALAERRPDDLKRAAEKLGQPVPSGRQLFVLRLMGLVAPGPSAPLWRRAGGVFLLIAFIVLLLAVGWGVAMLIQLPFGDPNAGLSIFWGFLLVCIALGVLIFVGRRKQKAAAAKAASERAEQAQRIQGRRGRNA